KGVESVRGQAVLLQEHSAAGRLQGRKHEIALRVTLEDELDRCCTEMAHAVEEDNCMVGWHAAPLLLWVWTLCTVFMRHHFVQARGLVPFRAGFGHGLFLGVGGWTAQPLARISIVRSIIATCSRCSGGYMTYGQSRCMMPPSFPWRCASALWYTSPEEDGV